MRAVVDIDAIAFNEWSRRRVAVFFVDSAWIFQRKNFDVMDCLARRAIQRDGVQ